MTSERCSATALAKGSTKILSGTVNHTGSETPICPAPSVATRRPITFCPAYRVFDKSIAAFALSTFVWRDPGRGILARIETPSKAVVSSVSSVMRAISKFSASTPKSSLKPYTSVRRSRLSASGGVMISTSGGRSSETFKANVLRERPTRNSTWDVSSMISRTSKLFAPRRFGVKKRERHPWTSRGRGAVFAPEMRATNSLPAGTMTSAPSLK